MRSDVRITLPRRRSVAVLLTAAIVGMPCLVRANGIGFLAIEGRWTCAGGTTARSYVAIDGALMGRDTLSQDSEDGETFALERFTREGDAIHATTLEGRSTGTLVDETLTLHGLRSTDGAPFTLTYAVDAGGGFVRRLAVDGTRTSERCLPTPGRAPGPCTMRDVPARLVAAAPPKWPDGTPHVAGEVVVAITLDASSQVVGAEISSSPSPALDDAALESAVESHYQGAITHCATLPATYLFNVKFVP
jgi:hypothetical protein